MSINQELARSFHERGFLVIDELFSAAKIGEIDKALRHFLDQLSADDSKAYVVYEPGPEQKIRNLFEMDRFDDYFAALAQEPLLIDLVSTIFNDRPVSMGVELFGKPARVGSEVPFHQDNAYFNLTPPQALTCWIALADSTKENGCVRYIEGSHQLGNLPHEASGVRGNSMRLNELSGGVGPEICGLVRRGGAILHHCNTIHRSEPNRSDRDRPGLLLVYKAAGCQTDQARVEQYDAILAAMK